MPPLLQRSASTADKLREIAAEFYRSYLSTHQVSLLLLEGELGAGKTTFCQGLKTPLAIRENITSPSFNLLNIYEGQAHQLWHYDLYRLSSGQDVIDTGFPDYWQEKPADSAPGRIHAIEWWQRAAELLPDGVPIFRVEIIYNLDVEDATRDVTIRSYGR